MASRCWEFCVDGNHCCLTIRGKGHVMHVCSSPDCACHQQWQNTELGVQTEAAAEIAAESFIPGTFPGVRQKFSVTRRIVPGPLFWYDIYVQDTLIGGILYRINPGPPEWYRKPSRYAALGMQLI